MPLFLDQDLALVVEHRLKGLEETEESSRSRVLAPLLTENMVNLVKVGTKKLAEVRIV